MSSTKFAFTWLNPNYHGEHFKNVMVLGINGQAANRAEFEDQLTAAIARPGMQVISELCANSPAQRYAHRYGSTEERHSRAKY